MILEGGLAFSSRKCSDGIVKVIPDGRFPVKGSMRELFTYFSIRLA
jgi:hypothetical protein